jgi:lipid-A-disaccharide synthase
VLILISAGEASGEMYGAQLIEALRREKTGNRAGTNSFSSSETDRISFFGVGGERMRAAGCETVVDAKDLAVVGITEILSHLPKILRLYKNLIREADRRKPDLAIVIDSPAFNWRVARQMKRRGIPTVYYVAPQFWAWRQGRVRLIRNYIDKALVIFPFEEKFYRDRGVDATFVGHPLAELEPPTTSRADYARQFQLDPAKQWITLMPGSRVKEVRMNLRPIVESAAVLGSQYEFLLPVSPTLDHNFLISLLRHQEREPQARKHGTTASASLARLNSSPSHIVQIRGITLVPQALPALYHSRAGIIASGTATVEAAMMNTPFVMVYRVSHLTYLLGRPRVKVPRFAMVNLIAEEEVVPELVQRDFRVSNVVDHLNNILIDGPARDRMLQGLAKVRSRLRSPGDNSGKQRHPADRAAQIICAMADSAASHQ